MSPSNWIAIISVSAVIAGWFINSYLARKNSTVNTRIKYRVEALRKVLEVYLFIKDNKEPYTNTKFKPLLETARFNMQLFGMNNEVALFEKLIESLEKSDNVQFKDNLFSLTELCLDNLRKELRLKKLNIRNKAKK